MVAVAVLPASGDLAPPFLAREGTTRYALHSSAEEERAQPERSFSA